MGKTSVDRVGNCGRQRTFDERDARALVRYVKKNRRATLPQEQRLYYKLPPDVSLQSPFLKMGNTTAMSHSTDTVPDLHTTLQGCDTPQCPKPSASPD
ncbi:hypothetical protein L3Q82_002511 [Scortum barcoo]|uniref:Uncharacterized protein n=1 Tax=Scortum barcoo TaxID=214431 RepID=A0ACB8VYS8_9TELE|nr:hypothetical protein L3Q82_002511 [Scortum barcoo]